MTIREILSQPWVNVLQLEKAAGLNRGTLSRFLASDADHLRAEYWPPLIRELCRVMGQVQIEGTFIQYKDGYFYTQPIEQLQQPLYILPGPGRVHFNFPDDELATELLRKAVFHITEKAPA